jgi:hypothetical protein
MIINLQYLTPNDPLRYLNKVKLGLYSLPDNKMHLSVQLITLEGTRYKLADSCTNLQLISLVNDLIYVTSEAMTVWCVQRSLYHRH